MATTAPTALGTAWTQIGADGFEYLVIGHDGPVFYAFGSTTPATTVLGYPLDGAQVLAPPTGQNVYGRASTSARVTVTQGNALS